MYINEYESKKHGSSVQIIGTPEEFEAAGISTEGAEKHKNSSNISIRGPADEMEANIAAIQVYEEALAKAAPSTLREWFTSHDESEMLMAALMTLGKKSISAYRMQSMGGISRADAHLLMQMMFEDGWVDANGVLTTYGIDELREIGKMLDYLRSNQ